MENRPRSREKYVTGGSAGVHRRGSGLGTGPVGKRPSSGDSGKRDSGGGGMSGLMKIIALLVVLLGGGGGAVSMLGGMGGATTPTPATTPTKPPTSYTAPAVNYYQNTSAQSTGVTNTTKPDDQVASGSRSKYTQIKGNGKDQVTVMVYMCGTDLESRSGMATNDLKEMASASYGDDVNVIVYTGGCKGWKINGISNQVNQIYQVKDGKMFLLEKDMGSKTMTDPSNLTTFIKYCTKNFPANRNDLILWDHGGGSISGYGYDEKFPNTGGMNLTRINKALTDAGVKFDFIGYDACLMATAENALMLNDHADYLIASEETEPGIGWYYTDWLTNLGKNTSRDTLSIGKDIVDGFVDTCARKCPGQLTTLSVIDLAEFANTVPDKLGDFAEEASKKIKSDEYKQVATARQSSREFATSSKIDQVDLVDLAKRMNTTASKKLASALTSAVKYNRTSSNMTNAYGVSIYFPNRKLSSVEQAVYINNSLGVDSAYSKCIQDYASLGMAGQTVSQGMGNSGNPYASLFGGAAGSSQTGSQGTAGADLAFELLQSLFRSSPEMEADGERTAMYIAENQFDATALKWNKTSDGYTMALSEDQWSLVTDLEMNMFYDDGEGYVDMGLDNVFDFTDAGDLIAETDKTWLAINGQPIAYYHTATMEDGDNYTITGYSPAMLNGERVNLLLVFDQDHPRGYITGAVMNYHDGETDTIAKADTELKPGDRLDFLCDFYTYSGDYSDTYYLGEPMEVTENMEISNVPVGNGGVLITYKFTDIYGQEYWTPTIK